MFLCRLLTVRERCVYHTHMKRVNFHLTDQQILALHKISDSTGIDVSVSIRQCGSDWSKEWEFALPAKDGASSFSRSFDPPPGKHRGDYELAVSAAGVPLSDVAAGCAPLRGWPPPVG